MTDNLTMEDINKMGSQLKEGINMFTSQITAQAEKARGERVSGIVALAVKAGKEAVYTAEKLLSISDESLEIVENSLNDLIKALEDAPDDDSEGGTFNDRGSQKPTQVSNYKRIDGLVDMTSLAFGLPILSEELKQEVRFEHIAAGLEY